MNVNNKIIHAKINKRNNVVNYFNNIENHHFNNSSLHSESMTNDKSAYSINSSSIFEKKRN